MSIERSNYQTPAIPHSEDEFLARLFTFLDGKSRNTRDTYQRGITDFFDFIRRHVDPPTFCKNPDHTMVALWKRHLQNEGKANSTVTNRLSNISSFFDYLVRIGYAPLNPVKQVERRDIPVSAYERAQKISLDDYKAIMAQIPTNTEIGLRDKALFMFYTLTARRRTEVARLRVADLRIDGDEVTYRIQLKGGRVKWKHMPPPVFDAIKAYWEASGRNLSKESPIFVATRRYRDLGNVLRRHYGRSIPENETPLTGEAIQNRLNYYARKAGLSHVHLHSLRHLGAQLFYDASGDILETRDFLDHMKVDTTQIYMEQLKGVKHKYWENMLQQMELPLEGE